MRAYPADQSANFQNQMAAMIPITTSATRISWGLPPMDGPPPELLTMPEF